jgi:hypothetical protein
MTWFPVTASFPSFDGFQADFTSPVLLWSLTLREWRDLHVHITEERHAHSLHQLLSGASDSIKRRRPYLLAFKLTDTLQEA